MMDTLQNVTPLPVSSPNDGYITERHTSASDSHGLLPDKFITFSFCKSFNFYIKVKRATRTRLVVILKNVDLNVLKSICIIHTMTAFSPESDINMCQVTAWHKSGGLLVRQNEHVSCHISDIVPIVTENAAQWRLLDLYQLFWFEHRGVLIPKPMQHKDHLFTECEGREGKWPIKPSPYSFSQKDPINFLEHY